MPKFYFTNVLPANIVIESKQLPIRSTNSIPYLVGYDLNFFIIDHNENSMNKTPVHQVSVMRILFNLLCRALLIRNAFFILFCLLAGTEAFSQMIVPPPNPFIKAPTTTTISSSANPSISGQPVMLTATVGSAGQITPTGTVHFYDNATNTDLTPAGVIMSNGKAMFTTAVLTANASFKATYSGDDANLASTSDAYVQSVNYPFIIITPNFFTTTTTLVSNQNPSVAGSQPVTFTATVTSSGGVNVAGVVEFWDNTNHTNLTPGGVTLTDDGIATFTTSSLPFGDLNITAVYRGDTNGNQQSTSNTVVQRVQLTITGIGVSLSVNLDKSTSSTAGTTNWGDQITFTATVSTGLGAPSGTVVFADNGYLLGSAAMDAAGNARLTTNLLTPGSHNIAASYFSITSNVLTHNVTPPYPPLPFGSPGAGLVPANVALIHNVGYNVISDNEKKFFIGNPSPFGKPITFAAHISGLARYTPTGSVLFQLLRDFNRYDLGEVGLDAAGDALFSTSILPLGRDTIRVIHSGNDVYEPNAEFRIVEVEAASTTTALSSNRNPAVAGQQITFIAKVASPYPESNAPVPGGTVFFNIDGIDQAPAPLSGNGIKAFLDISSLTPGSHTIKARYPGDANYKASNSATITQVLEPVGSAFFYFLGDAQSTPVNTMFLNSLMFNIMNINPKLVGGASITFTAPTSGPSGTFSNGTNSITVNTTPLGSVGVANSGPFTANGIGGTYTVSATVPGMGIATFTMTNTGGCDPQALAFTGSYADVSLGCNPANPDGSLGTATANDANGAVIVTSTDGPVVSDGCNRSKTRTFTAKDGCDNTATTSRTVRWIEDVTPPAFTGSYTDIDLGLNPANPTASLGTATATDACGTVTISSQDGSVVSNGCYRSITRTFTAKDGCNNTSTVSRKVTWISDVTPPTMLTKNITVQLTSGGNVIITPAQVDNGSFDACGIASYSLSKTTFLCSNIGNNTVTLTATDANGNTASATAVVTVEDKVAPTMLTKNITVQLTSGGNVIITPAQVDNGSFDACGIASYSLSKTTFLCSNIGNNTVTLTATDANGNTASATAVVTVEDKVAPTMLTKNITVQLTAGGNVIITPAQVDNGSFDACGIASYSLSKTTFLCSNIGNNTVTLTATDANGNTASATAVVTVEDKVAPIITSCPTIPVLCYNANGTYTIPALAATDNCGVSSISYVISGATSRNGNGANASGVFAPGISTITWTVKDGSNNSSTCSSTVKVDKVDATLPDVFAQGINSSIGLPNTIYIGYGGSSVTLTAQVTGSLSPNSYTYKWTTGSPAGKGFANTQSVTVNPSVTTTYYLSIKDANNCAPLMQVTKDINVVDIRCGTNKINVCQFKNGSYSTVCVSASSKTINSLAAGSYLGTCAQTIAASTTIREEKITASMEVRAMPNPTPTNFRIAIESNDLKTPVRLIVTDIMGRVVETKTTSAGQTITVGDKYRNGMYILRMIQGKETRELKLVKLAN